MKNKKRFCFIIIALALVFAFMLSGCEEKCDHSLEVEIEEPTCSTPGKKTTYCTKCGEEVSVEEIPADGVTHTPKASDTLTIKNQESKNNAKCGEKYNIYGICSECGEECVLRTGIKESHKYSEETTWYEQIVNEDGSIDQEKHYKCTGYICDECGEVNESTVERVVEYHNAHLKYESDPAKAIEHGCCLFFDCKCDCGLEYEQEISHSWDEGKVITQPTCESGGVIIYTCQHEGCIVKTKQKDLPATGHTFATDEKDCDCCDRECIVCHQIVAATHAHYYEHDADCCDRVCEKCGYSIPHTIEHEYADNYTCHDRSCIYCGGETIYHTIDHLLKDTTDTRQDCTKAETYTCECERCGDFVEFEYSIIQKQHDYTIEIGTVDATCTTDGYKIVKCEHCQQVEHIVIKSSGHDYELISSTPATCTTDGEKVYQCKKCKDIKKEVIAAKGHSYEDDFLCHDRYCTVCGFCSVHTENHEYETGSTICKRCGDNIVMDTPILVYDSDNKIVHATVETPNTKYYLDGVEFDGYLLGKSPGAYTVTAQNIDPDEPIRNSAVSEPLTVVVIGSKAKFDKKSTNGNEYIQASFDGLNVGYTIKLEVDFYKGDQKIDSQTYTVKNSYVNIFFNNRGSNKETADKLVIKLVVDATNVILYKEEVYYVNIEQN